MRACVLGVDLPHAASGPGSSSPATDTIRWRRDHVHLEGTIGLMIEISCRGLFGASGQWHKNSACAAAEKSMPLKWGVREHRVKDHGAGYHYSPVGQEPAGLQRNAARSSLPRYGNVSGNHCHRCSTRRTTVLQKLRAVQLLRGLGRRPRSLCPARGAQLEVWRPVAAIARPARRSRVVVLWLVDARRDRPCPHGLGRERPHQVTQGQARRPDTRAMRYR